MAAATANITATPMMNASFIFQAKISKTNSAKTDSPSSFKDLRIHTLLPSPQRTDPVWRLHSIGSSHHIQARPSIMVPSPVCLSRYSITYQEDTSCPPKKFFWDMWHFFTIFLRYDLLSHDIISIHLFFPSYHHILILPHDLLDLYY